MGVMCGQALRVAGMDSTTREAPSMMHMLDRCGKTAYATEIFGRSTLQAELQEAGHDAPTRKKRLDAWCRVGGSMGSNFTGLWRPQEEESGATARYSCADAQGNLFCFEFHHQVAGAGSPNAALPTMIVMDLYVMVGQLEMCHVNMPRNADLCG
eukprot:gene2118-biopygen21464